MLYIKRLFLALATAAFVAGCSSGGGGPGTADVTSENAQDLAVAGTEATKAAGESETIPYFKAGPTNSLNAQDLSKQVLQRLYATTNLSSFCDNPGGVFSMEYPDNATSNYTATVTFSNCQVYDGYTTVTIDGTMTINATSSSANVDANLTFTESGVTETVDFTATCSISGQSVGTCTYSTSVTGADGRTYTVADLSVSGNNSTGYTVSGSVTDPDHGVVTITTNTPVTFNCPDGSPDNGSITVSGNGSATVEFLGCDSFRVTVDGTPATYFWADI